MSSKDLPTSTLQTEDYRCMLLHPTLNGFLEIFTQDFKFFQQSLAELSPQTPKLTFYWVSINK